jgi:hypothetical protein
MALGAVSNRRFVDQLRKEMNRPAKPRTPADDEATIQSAIRAAIEMAETLLKEIEDDADAKWGQSLDPSPAIDLGKLLEARAALVAAPFAEVDALNSVEPVPEWTNRATLALQKILALHGDAESEARHRLNAVARRMPTLDPRDWQATRLGDARYARDSYVRDTYGASFDYLWPKVRMAVGDGEADDAKAVARSVADAASLVDFAALLLVLALTIPAVWLPVIIVNDKPVFAFLAIGVGAPIALAMFYELLIRAEMAFGIVVQNIVDRYHLAIFPMLSLPVPATLSAERDLWSRVEQASWSSAGVDLVYKLPATTT